MIDVTAAIIGRDGKYLISQRKGGTFDGKWEFPGGCVENDETPEQCLRRELEEELEIDSVIGDFFAESVHDYGHKKVRITSYFVKHFSGKILPKVHYEHRWVSPNEIRNYDFIEADKPFIDKLMNL